MVFGVHAAQVNAVCLRVCMSVCLRAVCVLGSCVCALCALCLFLSLFICRAVSVWHACIFRHHHHIIASCACRQLVPSTRTVPVPV
jgi:hypothetical protein